MRKISIAIGLFLATVALADDGTTPPPPSAPGGHARRGGKRLQPGGENDDTNTIHGRCIIEENANNPLPGPCVNLLLILNDGKGNEVEKARTTPEGKFEFTAAQGKNYKIISGSRFYEVSSPKDSVQGGQRVDLILQQKP